MGNDGVDVESDRRPVPAETTTPILAVRANVGAGELDVDRDVLGPDGPAAACGR